jgi:uncharacterized membrane protein
MYIGIKNLLLGYAFNLGVSNELLLLVAFTYIGINNLLLYYKLKYRVFEEFFWLKDLFFKDKKSVIDI